MRLLNAMLDRPGAIAGIPRTKPAFWICDPLKLENAPPRRPNWLADTPVIPFAKRALRYEFSRFPLPANRLFSKMLRPLQPAPHHGWNLSNGASATHPRFPNPNPNPVPTPNPKNPT